jgi:hypothetical protein
LKPGVELVADLALNQCEIHVSATGFEDERFLFAELRNLWQANNPASSIAKQGDLLDITVTLGTIRLAPTVTIPSDVKLPDDNPRAALVDRRW